MFATRVFVDATESLAWCLSLGASVIAIDAPCRWSSDGGSRQAERSLEVGRMKIQCFSTPTRGRAVDHTKGFYDWVLNGERLYEQLKSKFPLFDGTDRKMPICFETFPQAVACSLAGMIVPARRKATR